MICLRDLAIAQLSLDEVQFHIGERQHDSLELEIELNAKGTLDHLRALAAALADFNLQPQPLSKFERGLRLLPPP
ncbi:MAG: hypothetical protein FJ030_16530 [Chloroflexi bacterium]|nr:hypothetical protein [Chloroflexota bacterium]